MGYLRRISASACLRISAFACIGGLPLMGQTVIALSPQTSPASAQVAYTSISVVGSGFTSNHIPVANVRVKLVPAAGGREFLTQPVSVQPLFGTSQKIVFVLPQIAVVTAPTPYQVSVTGITAAGSFTSTNATLTLNPPPQISLSPSFANAGTSLSVTITGQYTNFLQGATQAAFGPGVSVGGAASGSPGPVTVTSPTTAIAQLAIDPTAPVEPHGVLVSSGVQVGGSTFTVNAGGAVISISTATTIPITPGVSGFDDEFLTHGVEYWDPKYLAMVGPMKPGWLRFPGGTPTLAYDWRAGHLNQTWVKNLAPLIGMFPATSLLRGYQLTQAKGGVYLSDYATYAKGFNAWPIVCINGYTDTHPNQAGNMVTAAFNLGLNVHEWELSNEPWEYPMVFPTSTDYANSQYNPYYQNIVAANPLAITGIDYQGQFSGPQGTYQAWDNGLNTYTPQYWNGVTIHMYPINTPNLTPPQEEADLAGVLVHGTQEYLNSYLLPLIGQNTPIFVTEVNDGHFSSSTFKESLYNGIYLAEFTMRMATAPNVKAVGITNLYQGNTGTSGMIRAPNDFETYLIDQVKANSNFSTNTATDPNTQFTFYYSAPGLAVQVMNQAINNSSRAWPTTLTGGPTVPILGYDGQPVPAIFAQGYPGDNGTNYLVLTNKSNQSIPVSIQVNGTLLQQPLTVSTVSSSNDQAVNSATDQNAVQITSGTSSNPITVGPFSVTRVEW